MNSDVLIVLVIAITILSIIKTIILHCMLDNIEDMLYLIKSMKFDFSTSSNKLTELNSYVSFMSGSVMDIRKKLNGLGKKKGKGE